MKFLIALALALSGFFGTAQAATTPNEVRAELIDKLQADGSLTAQAAATAKTRYAVEPIGTSWTDYISLSNVLKTLAVVALLIAFSGWITQLVKYAWFLIIAVPVEVYQLVFAGAALGLMFDGQHVWASQAYYLTLFGAFILLATLVWFGVTHPMIIEALIKLFNLGIPAASIASFWFSVYFTALAFYFQSKVFGFFGVVGLSGALGFGLYYSPGILFLEVRKNMSRALIGSHLILLFGYCLVVKYLGDPNTTLFAAGFEYYASIALGVAVLIDCGPWGRESDGSPLPTLALAGVLATLAFGFFGVQSIGAILMVFGVLLLIEWIMYIGWQVGMLFGLAVSGVTLYTAGFFIEQYGRNLAKLTGM